MRVKNRGVICPITAWCSEVGSLTSLDAPELHVSSDVREPILLHPATCKFQLKVSWLWSWIDHWPWEAFIVVVLHGWKRTLLAISHSIRPSLMYSLYQSMLMSWSLEASYWYSHSSAARALYETLYMPEWPRTTYVKSFDSERSSLYITSEGAFNTFFTERAYFPDGRKMLSLCTNKNTKHTAQETFGRVSTQFFFFGNRQNNKRVRFLFLSPCVRWQRLTIPSSTALPSMTTVDTWFSHTIRQKSAAVLRRGLCVAM